jgi:hypothetical protein
VLEHVKEGALLYPETVGNVEGDLGTLENIETVLNDKTEFSSKRGYYRNARGEWRI